MNTVWLASYPKSGNTWVRAILTGLSTHPLLFRVNGLSAGQQPHVVGAALDRFGIDHRWLSPDDLDHLRAALVVPPDAHGTDDDGPLFRKTHERFRVGEPGREPFPAAATRAAILVVRDPRDVVTSFASFFGIDVDTAIDHMAADLGDGRASPAFGVTSQPWGSWSSHAVSWLDDDVPFPVHVVRYEDLHADPAGALRTVLADVGLVCTDDEVLSAADQARFDRLRDAEDGAKYGFREVSRSADRFFRRGLAGGWRDELSDRQVAAVEADHGDVMHRFGYATESDESLRAAVGEARLSRRRRAGRGGGGPDPVVTGSALGLEVRFGHVPERFDDSVEGAVEIAGKVTTTPSATIARLGRRVRVLVEHGRTVTVDWPDDPEFSAGDRSWVVHGWAAVIATIQRGDVSLHASTVRIGDETVAIAGHTRTGKSTTCMGLRQRGHELLVDDATTIVFRDGVPHVVPSVRGVHLLPDSAAALNIDFETLDVLAGGRAKAVFVPPEPDLALRRLDRIVVLRRSAHLDSPELVDAGAERVPIISEHCGHAGLAAAIVGQQRFFDQVVAIADHARVQVLGRPAQQWSLDAVLDLIDGGA